MEVPPDIVKALWIKFLMVTSFGGVGSITRAPIGVMRAIPETRRLLERCLQEVLAVAKARGVPMADAVVADTMNLDDALPANGTTSLQRDIADGKMTELEYWNGAVVRLGARFPWRRRPMNLSMTACCLRNCGHGGRLIFP